MIKVTVEGEVPTIAVAGHETMQQVSAMMRDGIEGIFYRGGYPGKWQPLRSKPFGPATLYRTGRLFNSLQTKSDESSAEVYVPSNLRYGAYLHYGTRKMLPRPFMLWTDEMMDQAVDMVAESVRFEQSLPEGWNP